jgi:hypothetical protein
MLDALIRLDWDNNAFTAAAVNLHKVISTNISSFQMTALVDESGSGLLQTIQNEAHHDAT